MNKRICAFICMFVIVLFLVPSTAYSDTGPKPELTILVENPPTEDYYLDLLIKEHDNSDNMGDERKEYDSAMLQKLKSLESEGWYPAYSDGASGLLNGDLIGKVKGNLRSHTFGYMGVPETYRIIVVTKSGNVQTSDIQKRYVMQSTITYDYSTGKVSESPVVVSYLIQFLMTCVPTLLIEGIILLLFGFKFKENWKPFLLVNLGTQILLTATMGASLIKSGTLSAYIVMFPVELAILIVEMVAYAKLLQGKSRGRRLAYAACANLASWILGFFMISDMFSVISKL